MWKGEKNFNGYFCLRGFKCLCILIMWAFNYLIGLINELRVLQGLVEKEKWTWQKVLTKMDNLMEEHKSDDEGAEEV